MLNDILTNDLKKNSIIILIALTFFVGGFFVALPAFAAPSPTVTSISPSSGPTAGGTNVTIVGTGFFTGLTVTIGNNAATNVVRVNSTNITATTPAGTAGVQNVTVTNTDTQSGILTNGFTYETPAPTPTPSETPTPTPTPSETPTSTPTSSETPTPLPTSSPTPLSSGGGGGGTPITVTFSGQAYPGSTIEVLRKSAQDALFQIIPTESASIKEDGTFEISHSGLISAEYLYALRIKDKDGRKTTLSFDVNLLIQSSFALKDILVPPTVEPKSTILLRSENLQLIGYAAPNNTIEVEIDGMAQKGTALSDNTGYYAFVTSVGPLAVGTHYARVRQADKDGKKSDWSQTKSFKKSLLLALKADFNSDGKVNITDWSVFLFRWGSPDQKLRSAIDLDGNGKVDVIDLSIFLKTIQI